MTNFRTESAFYGRIVKKSSLIVAIFLAALIMMTPMASAAVGGSISGVVYNSNGYPLGNAKVDLNNYVNVDTQSIIKPIQSDPLAETKRIWDTVTPVYLKPLGITEPQTIFSNTMAVNTKPNSLGISNNYQLDNGIDINIPFPGLLTSVPQVNDTLMTNLMPSGSIGISPFGADSDAINLAPLGTTASISSQNSNSAPSNTPPLGVSAPIISQTSDTSSILVKPTGSAAINPLGNDTTAVNTAPANSATINLQTSDTTATNTAPLGTSAPINSQTNDSQVVNIQPLGAAGINSQNADTTATNSAPLGSATINLQNSDTTATNTAPSGSSAGITPQTDDTTDTNTQPSGSAVINSLNVDTTSTNSAPVGSATINLQNSDTTATNTAPTGTSASITSQSDDTTVTNIQPLGAVGINSQNADTAAINSAPTGSATINLQNSDAAPTNTAPTGTSASITSQSDDTTVTNTQPSGSAGINSQSADTVAINLAPSGSAAINAQNSNTVATNIQPSGTSASITPQSSDTDKNNTKPLGLSDPTNKTSIATQVFVSPSGTITISINSAEGTDTIIQPNGAPDSISGTWYTGSFTIEGDDDGDGNPDETIYWVLTDVTASGVYDIINLSYEDNTNFDDGDRNDHFAGTGDDEGLPDGDYVVLGTYNFTVDFESDPSTASPDAWLTSTEWYNGTFAIDLNGDGSIGADELMNYTLSDSNSDGIYDTIDMSTDDEVYGEGTLDDDQTAVDDDERFQTGIENITFETYLFNVSFKENPSTINPDAEIQSKEWYNKTFTIDADDDGVVDDIIYFVISDMDSDGLYDTMDLSLDTTYGEGTLDDGSVSTGDDEQITATEFITLGSSLEFTVGFDVSPVADADDARITSHEWYAGSFTIDGNGDGAVEANNIHYVLTDTDSDGLYEAMDISCGDEVYGEGNVGDFTVDFHATDNTNDERMTTSTDITLGDYFLFTVDFDDPPNLDTTDASITSKEWYEGTFTIDADGDGLADDDVYFVLSDTDSDGLYEAMDISIGDQVYGEGTLNDLVVDFHATDNTNDERATVSSDITLGDYYLFTVEFDDAPNVDTNDARVSSKEWYEGSFIIDSDSDGSVDDTFNFVLSDTNSDGVYDTMDISIDTTYGEGTLGNGIVTTGDDEQITASDFLTLGGSLEFEVGFDASPTLDADDARIMSNEWYTGSFTIDGDGDGAVESNNIHYALTDTDSDGLYEAMDISCGDEVYGEGNVGDFTVDFHATDNTNDEQMTTATDITLGDYFLFTVDFDDAPNMDANDANITSKEWYEGIFTIDADGDGVADDDVYIVLSDTDSDGIYEAMDISIGDEDYGEGTLNDLTVDFHTTDNTDDERATVSSDITLGDYFLFTVDFDDAPNVDTNDARITSKEWYEGTFTIDSDSDGSVDDVFNFALTDTDSDGLYDTMDISLDTTYGQGTLGNGIVSTGDDEQITTSDFLTLGGTLEFEVEFDASPTLDTDDARITSHEWYAGTFTIDANGNGALEPNNVHFVLSDTNSDGLYEAIDISMGDEVYGEGDQGDSTVDFSTTDNTNDERMTTSTDITLGDYFLFTVDFDDTPNMDVNDANITSKEWYEGTFTIDADGDGLADDNVYFVLSDTDSDGLYEAVDLTIGDQVYGEGTLNDLAVNFHTTDNTDDERATISSDITLGDYYLFTVDFDGPPNADANDARITSKEWYEGTFTIDSDNDGIVDDTIYFALSDTNSEGVYDTMDISIDTTYGQGTLNNDIVSAGDDELISASDYLTLGDYLEFEVGFDASPTLDNDDARITSHEWYTGTFTIDGNGDGAVESDNIHYALTDTNSDGLYEAMDISCGDEVYGEGDLGDFTVDFHATDNTNDEQMTATTDITLGDYFLFTVDFDDAPNMDANDASITSKEWYEGTFTIDADGDGSSDDDVHFVLSDTDSDGLYEAMDISIGDEVYGEGTLNDLAVDFHATDNTNDERMTASSDITLGDYYLFTVDFDDAPNVDTNDIRITSKEWYEGTFTIDSDSDGSVDDVFNFALSDTDSDGLYDTMDISLDTTFGEGTLGNGIVSTGDDEQITAPDYLTLGDSLEFEVEFDASPTLDTNDARITSHEWYTGSFTIDGDGDGAVEPTNIHYVLTDTDSDGLYEAMDISCGDEIYGEGNVGDFTVDFHATDNTNDERMTSATDITLGDYFLFTVDFDDTPNMDANDASIESKQWYEGIFTIDCDGDGLADDDVYFVLSDTDSDGLYEAMDISIGDEVYGEGLLNDLTVDFHATDNTNDERITLSSDITLGDYYQFTVEFDDAPNVDTTDARITSKEWYEGTFTIDSDNDGLVDDTIYFVLSDTNSDGVYDTMDISVDTIYGQGTLNNGIANSGNDEQITASEYVTLGISFEFLVEFDASPVIDSDDARITSNEWYTGTFTIDGNGDGTLESNNVYFVLSDTNSDGLYEAMDISMGDEVYGEGDIGDSVVDFSESDNTNDERITSSADITLGDYFLFTAEFDSVPNQDSDDARITSSEWYNGDFQIDADGDGQADDDVHFVLVDTDSDGLYEVLEISIGDEVFGEGNVNDNYVDFDEVSNTNDEQISVTTDITLGDHYLFTVVFDDAPNLDPSDVRLISKQWYIGSFLIDADYDGTADDTVYFVLSDANSNGLYDTLDISIEDEDYGETGIGSLFDDIVNFVGPGDNSNDEQIIENNSVNLGDLVLFNISFDSVPVTDSDDVQILINEWYHGSFQIDADDEDDDGLKDDNAFYVLSDLDSDALYDVMDISINDVQFGEAGGGGLFDGIVDYDNDTNNLDDERITTIEDITLGDSFLFGVEFVNNPAGPGVNDAQILSKEWYTGSFSIDVDGDGSVDPGGVRFAMMDTWSQGLYDFYTEISVDDDIYAEGDPWDQMAFLNNDEVIIEDVGEFVVLGSYRYLIQSHDGLNDGLDVNDGVTYDENDTKIKISHWFAGEGLVEGYLPNAVIADIDSDGVFTEVYIDLNFDGDYEDVGVDAIALQPTDTFSSNFLKLQYTILSIDPAGRYFEIAPIGASVGLTASWFVGEIEAPPVSGDLFVVSLCDIDGDSVFDTADFDLNPPDDGILDVIGLTETTGTVFLNGTEYQIINIEDLGAFIRITSFLDVILDSSNDISLSNTIHFGTISESALTLNLNQDGDMTDIYYAIVVDNVVMGVYETVFIDRDYDTFLSDELPMGQGDSFSIPASMPLEFHTFDIDIIDSQGNYFAFKKTNNPVDTYVTNSDGTYSLTAPTDGDYWIYVENPSLMWGYADLIDTNSNSGINIASGNSIETQNQYLTRTGSFMLGFVNDSVTGQPLLGVVVDVYDNSGNLIVSTMTKDDGSYQVAVVSGTVIDIVYSLAGYYTDDGRSIGSWKNLLIPADTYTVDVLLVPDNIPPTITMDYPAEGQTVSGIVDITVTATDDFGISKTEVSFDYGSTYFLMTSSGGNTYTYSWDTTTIPQGATRILVRVTDFSGATDSDYSDVYVTNDATAPYVSIVSPVDSQYIQGSYAILVSASDNHALEFVNITLDANSFQTTYNPSSGYFEYHLDSTSFTDGLHSLSAEATDYAGNSATDILSTGIYIDNTAPTISIYSPSNGETVSGNTVFIDVDSVDEGDYIPTVEFRIDLGAWMGLTGSEILGWADSWDSETVSNGIHTISFRSYDDIGHVVTESIEITVDNDVPRISIVAPLADEFLKGTYTFSVSAKDDIDITEVYITINSVDYTLEYNSANGLWEVSLDTTTFTDGYYSVTATAKDEIPTHTQTTASLDFVIDNNAPTLFINSPADNEKVFGAAQSVDCDSQDEGAFIPTVEYRIDSGSWIVLAGSEALGWTDSWDSSSVSNGVHTISFRAYDESGNLVSDYVIVTVDNDVPQVEIVNPAADEYIQGIYTFRISAYDDITVTKVTLTLGGNDYITGYNSASGLWEVEIDTTTIADGTYGLSATAEDGIPGHTTSTTSFNFNIDNNAPTLSVNTPSDGETLFGSSVSIDVSSSDSGPFVPIVQYKIDSGAWILLSGSEVLGWTGTWDSQTVVNGIHTLSFRAYDDIGNMVTDSVLVTVDNDMPQVTIVAPLEDEYISGKYTFQVSASDEIGVMNVFITINSVDYTAGYNTQSGLWEVTLDTTLFLDGTYGITATASDGIPSHTQITSSFNFNIDNNSPSLSIISPSNGETVYGSAVTVEVNSEDEGVFVPTVQYRIGSGMWVTQSGSEALGWTGSFDSTMYSNGIHTLWVRAYDDAQHVVSDSVSITVDNDNPQAVISAPVEDEYVQGTYTFKVSASDDIGVTMVTLTIDTNDYIMGKNSASGFWEITLDTSIISDGIYGISAKVEDGIPSHTQTTIMFTFNIDNNAPTLSIVSPLQDETVTGSNVGLEVDSEDDGPFTPVVQFRIDSGAWTSLSGSEALGWTDTLDSTLLSNGYHTITFRAYDEIGHVVTDSVSITVDNDLPSVSMIQPVAGEFIQGTYTFRASASDDVGVTKVTITINGNDYSAGYNIFSGFWEVSLDTTTISDGSVSVSAKAEDGVSGHTQTTSSFLFNIDNTSPILNINSPSSGEYVRGFLVFDVTGSDTFIDSVKYNIDGTGWILNTTIWDTQDVTDGDHTIMFMAVDHAGHSVSQSITLIVDNQDTDSDGIGDLQDPDLDGDGVDNEYDAFPDDHTEWYDNDGDGLGDNSDADDDNDGIIDIQDDFPSNPNEWVDSDGDNIGNNADLDDDGDNVFDTEDVFPLDDTEWVDWDSDGIGNNADLDDDGDGVNDANDVFPMNPDEFMDSDSDGIGDNSDNDIDGDGVYNSNDVFPYNRNESSDMDNDGIGDSSDSDIDGDGVLNTADDFPQDPNESSDSDDDGMGDVRDPDDDNDGSPDVIDVFPYNDLEWRDMDSDGEGDNNDDDIDGDGVGNDKDEFPTNPTEWEDTDKDGVGNNADWDDDGDDVADDNDYFPHDKNASLEPFWWWWILISILIVLLVFVTYVTHRQSPDYLADEEELGIVAKTKASKEEIAQVEEKPRKPKKEPVTIMTSEELEQPKVYPEEDRIDEEAGEEIECPSCGESFTVEVTGGPQVITCPHCGVSGTLD
jgi:hypothetical protein